MEYIYDPKPTPEQSRQQIILMVTATVVAVAAAFGPWAFDTTAAKTAISVPLSVVFIVLAVKAITLGASIGSGQRDEAARLLNDRHGLSLSGSDVRYLLSDRSRLRVRESGEVYEFWYDGAEITCNRVTAGENR